jgi:peptide/nickel transport system substrate-binding protein
MKRAIGIVALVLISLLVGCGPAQRQATETAGDQPRQGRTLTLAHRYEPPTLAPKVAASNGPLSTTRLFNAALALYDDQGAPRPYLAQELPQLNSDTWRVFPDGRMETTYRLRDGLTWQDGAPLTAEDFAFALRVYKDPDLGIFLRAPQGAIESVVAADPGAVVIQWRSLNPDAGMLSFGDLDPLPTHLLEPAFTDYKQGQASRETFVAKSFWTTEYVGAGPYRLERWEPGVQLEGAAFDGHALGRAKIDRLLVRIAIDENATLAAVLTGGQFDYTRPFALRFDHLLVLKREWEPAGKGTALAVPSRAAYLTLQQKPEVVGDEALLDLRVRRAIAHTLEREALNEGLFGGMGFPAETSVPRTVSFYPDLERMMARYPLDPARAGQLMTEAGFTRDAEGFFTNRQGRRVRLDFAVQTSTELERMQAILSDAWRRSGFDVHQAVLGVKVWTERQTSVTIPGLKYTLAPAENSYIAAELASAATGWAGQNVTGWTHPDYERLWNAASVTLDSAQRGRYVAEMMALVSDQLPGYPLYYTMQVSTWVAALQGPDDERQSPGFGLVAKATTNYWNVHEWTFR